MLARGGRQRSDLAVGPVVLLVGSHVLCEEKGPSRIGSACLTSCTQAALCPTTNYFAA